MSETRRRQPGREEAEAIAVAGLAFLAEDPERLERFLALSGLSPGDIRQAATQPGFLAGVLHHIMQDDRIAAAFAMAERLSPEALVAATAVLESGWEQDRP
jgi:hypothetical protein